MRTLVSAGFIAITCTFGLAAIGCGGGATMAATPKGSAPALTEPSAAFGGDATPSAPPADVARERALRDQDESGRPGLGTEWGETRLSRISTVPFVRGDFDTPFATATLFYNDEQGARAMANAAAFRRTTSGAFTIAGGAVQVGLRDGDGELFEGFVADGKNYVVGEAGRRYTIVLKNLTDSRFEVVASVDGLDVLDGKPASFRKRGYVLEARDVLEIDGFRQSEDTVAAFRFGSVRDSYAGQKHGDTRNVGVIGIAVFHERGDDPFDRAEVRRRHRANPFPGQFASPP